LNFILQLEQGHSNSRITSNSKNFSNSNGTEPSKAGKPTKAGTPTTAGTPTKAGLLGTLETPVKNKKEKMSKLVGKASTAETPVTIP
jgi:hypothetical protein